MAKSPLGLFAGRDLRNKKKQQRWAISTYKRRELGLDKKSIVIAHDTFGAMAVALNAYRPHSVINQASQLKALRKNLENNGLDTKEVIHSNPLKIQATNVNLALVKVFTKCLGIPFTGMM